MQRGGKKSPKFACKVCGAKQSVQVVFARSARAADMRKAVQALNQGRADKEARADAAHMARAAAGFDGVDGEGEGWEAPQAAPSHGPGGSKWAAYLDEPEEEAPAAAAGDADDARYVASFEAARAAKRRSSLGDDPLSKRAALASTPPLHAAFVAPPAAHEALEQQQRAPEPRLRWGGVPAPAPLSPRNARVAPEPRAGAGGGKWAAFAAGGDEDDW